MAGVGQEEAMGLVDKAKNKVEEGEGKSKEATGRATGDNKLKAEGKADQAKLKQTGEKLRMPSSRPYHASRAPQLVGVPSIP
jgi:uncharacterized protein YjbJ (UPF0337 family)